MTHCDEGDIIEKKEAVMEQIIFHDFVLLNTVVDFCKCKLLDVIMPLITVLADHGIVPIIIGLILLLIPKTRRIGLSMAFSFIYGGVFGNLILKNLVARPRPYSEIYPLQLRMFSESELLIEGLSDFSFPSGHTLIAFELAFVLVLMLRGRKEAISVFALIMASLIGFSRVYLYVHFPLDVLTGALLGCVFAILGVNTVKLIYKLINPKSHQT